MPRSRKKTQDEIRNPVSYMIGKDSSFDRRSIEPKLQAAFSVHRPWSPQTALIKANALGYKVTKVNDLTDMLRHATRRLAVDNSNLLILEALMRAPSLPTKIASIIYPKDQIPVDTSVPVVTFTEFANAVKRAVEMIDPIAASVPGIVEIITYTYGRPAIEQHFVLPARDMINIDLEPDLIPDYEDIKSAGLATLLEHAIEGTKASFSTLGAKKIVPKLLFDTIRSTLMVLSDKLIELRFQWQSFDALAAVSVAKLTGAFDQTPEHVGFLKNPEVEMFTRNFTLVQASLNYFVGAKSVRSLIPTLVDAEAYFHNFRGLTNAITQSPLLKQVPLEAFVENTNITRLFAPNRLLLAVLLEPSFHADPSAQVSYFANTAAEQGAVLTPMADLETHIRGLFQPLAVLARTSTIELHNVIVNAIMDDGDMLAAEAGAALQLSLGADKGTDFFPGFAYTPSVLTRSMSEEYLAHVGAAHSSYISITAEDESITKPVLSYFFSPTTPDIHFLVTAIDTGVAVTQDPALVTALRGAVDTPIHRAQTTWPVAAQVLEDDARRALILNQPQNLSLFPDLKNSLDRKETIVFNLSRDVSKVMDATALTATTSLYELLGGPTFPGDQSVVQVHFNPILSMQVEGIFTMLASLFKTASAERGRQAAVTAGVHLLKPLLQSRDFQIIYRGLLAQIAQHASTPAQRMYLMRSMANIFDVVQLQIALIFLILLRTRLISLEAYQQLNVAEIWTSEQFRTALATSIAP